MEKEEYKEHIEEGWIFARESAEILAEIAKSGEMAEKPAEK